jgi:hypothetical protein
MPPADSRGANELTSSMFRHQRCPRASSRPARALLNTSFNVAQEPLVGTPEDATRCFQSTGTDALLLEDHLLSKSAARA